MNLLVDVHGHVVSALVLLGRRAVFFCNVSVLLVPLLIFLHLLLQHRDLVLALLAFSAHLLNDLVLRNHLFRHFLDVRRIRRQPLFYAGRRVVPLAAQEERDGIRSAFRVFQLVHALCELLYLRLQFSVYSFVFLVKGKLLILVVVQLGLPAFCFIFQLLIFLEQLLVFSFLFG